MGFEYIKKYYKVPAELYREVLFKGKKGVITGNKEQYIEVVLYDDPKRNNLLYHPTWEITYLQTFNYKPPKAKNWRSKRRYDHFLSLDSNMTFFEYLKSDYCL